MKRLALENKALAETRGGKWPRRVMCSALALTLLVLLSLVTLRSASAQEQSTSQQSEPKKTEPTKEGKQAAPEREGFGKELAEETRESTGDDKEENENLKHASSVRWMAQKTGLSVHQAHLVALFINFAIVVGIIGWAAYKFLPAMFRDRTSAIQRALEEARSASQDANRRLADIENRLRQLDVEIGRMQASAEKEADAEEIRIQKAAEEDIRKVVLAAEQEIAAASKQARRELAVHSASLAIALASKQINVDATTDQMLVRSFASTLASNGGQDGNNGGNGKDKNKNKDERGKGGR
jgi:F-type H+-transporting ATPase subunit b